MLDCVHECVLILLCIVPFPTSQFPEFHPISSYQLVDVSPIYIWMSLLALLVLVLSVDVATSWVAAAADVVGISASFCMGLAHDPALTPWVVPSIRERCVQACHSGAVARNLVWSIVELQNVCDLARILLIRPYFDVRFWRKVPYLYFALVAFHHAMALLLAEGTVQISLLLYPMEHLLGACLFRRLLTARWTHRCQLWLRRVHYLVDFSLKERIQFGLEFRIKWLVHLTFS